MMNLLIKARNVAKLGSFAKNTINVASPAFHQNGFSIRSFGVPREPEPDVVDEEDEEEGYDGSEINYPYLRDRFRIEIYKKFLDDPIQWSAKNLAKHYGADLDRIRGVLLLLETRYERMRSEGFEINTETGEAIIPEKWQLIYDKKKEDETLSYSALAEVLEMPGQAAEVERIFKAMDVHSFNKANLDESQVMGEELAEEFGENGVDVHKFREVAWEKGDVSNANEKTWADKYYPKLLGDDDYEDEKQRLLRQIEADTKAVLYRDFYYYQRKNLRAGEPMVAESTDGITETSEATAAEGESEGEGEAPAAAAAATQKRTLANDYPNSIRMEKPNHDHSKVEKFSRWKFAFRDISFLNYKGAKASLANEDPDILATQDLDSEGNKKEPAQDTRRRQNVASFAAPKPTMILTRGGVWRRANPMEEAMRSWTRHPTFLDLNNPVNRARVQYYNNDWDGDEELMKAQRAKKKETRQALLAGLKK